MSGGPQERGARADVTAIVLAGGRSLRFGGPKLAATIDGATVLDHALDAAEQVASAIVIAGPAPARASNRDAAVRAVPDDEPFAGPLAALAGALLASPSELAIVVGGDMPALVPRVLILMLDRLRSDPSVDAVILEGPEDPTRTQTLPLALRVGPGSTAASEALAAGDRSLVRLLARLATAAIPAGEWRRLDPAGATTTDIDVPADLDRARGNEIR